MEVEDLLARAWRAVADAGIPEPLQEFAFKEALARLSAGPVPSVPPPAGGQTSSDSGRAGMTIEGDRPASDPTSRTSEELFAKFAHESGVPVADLERVFYFTDGVPHLNGPRSKFGRTTAVQAKTIAVALTAAYDYALDKRSVADSIVRAEAVRLKADLGGNWAREMNDLKDVSWIGAARQKEFKTKADTPEAVQRLISAVLGTPAE